MKSVTTYLHFNGNCREAMSFYQTCLGGELHLQPYPMRAASLRPIPARRSCTPSCRAPALPR